MLWAPVEYKKLSSCDKDRICNGCGSKGLGGIIVPDTLWGLSIEEACDIHDFMYARGKTIEDKKEADRVFLNNMQRIIAAKKSYAILTWLRRRRAKTYYEAVKYFGGPAFWCGKNHPDNIMEA